MSKAETTKKYVKFGLTEAEYNRLALRAEENGSTVPQTVRWLLFRKGGINVVNSTKNLQTCTEATCQEFLQTFRKVSENFTRITAKIESFQPSFKTDYLKLLLEEAAKNISQSRDILATTFGMLNMSDELQDECRNIAIPVTKDKENITAKDTKTNLKNYFYMQKITICGAIAAEPETFTSKNNSELTRFTVTCDEKGEKTNYDVYASAYIVSEILPLLTVRRQVIVTGDFRIRSSTSKSGAAQNPLSIRADSITLGMEVLQ